MLTGLRDRKLKHPKLSKKASPVFQMKINTASQHQPLNTQQWWPLPPLPATRRSRRSRWRAHYIPDCARSISAHCSSQKWVHVATLTSEAPTACSTRDCTILRPSSPRTHTYHCPRRVAAITNLTARSTSCNCWQFLLCWSWSTAASVRM